jgi:hypothetical protein
MRGTEVMGLLECAPASRPGRAPGVPTPSEVGGDGRGFAPGPREEVPGTTECVAQRCPAGRIGLARVVVGLARLAVISAVSADLFVATELVTGSDLGALIAALMPLGASIVVWSAGGTLP